jgi:hypothetical protein
MTVIYVRLPATYAGDFLERDAGIGQHIEVVRETRSGIVLRMDEPAMHDMLDDARHTARFTDAPKNIKRSAERAIQRLEQALQFT